VPSKAPPSAFPAGTPQPEDEIRRVAEWFRLRDPDGAITAEVIRDSIDLVLDGQRTGRWCYGHLTKTEKTHLGTIIEIELQKEFGISDEGPLDYAIDGIPVDCKYAATFGHWQIPREMYRQIQNGVAQGADHIALLIWAHEASQLWRAGLMRVSDRKLRPGKGNQDRKRTIAPEFLSDVHFIWAKPAPMPENTLLEMTDADRKAVFASASGQTRIDELLRRVQRRTLRRTVIETVAQQDDPMKRPRDARARLRAEGVLVFGHESGHRRVAKELGLDAHVELPDKGEYVSARVVKVDEKDPRRKTRLQGDLWALALDTEPNAPGPQLPRPTSK